MERGSLGHHIRSSRKKEPTARPWFPNCVERRKEKTGAQHTSVEKKIEIKVKYDWLVNRHIPSRIPHIFK